MTSYIERRYGNILKAMKAEIEAFDGFQKITTKVMLVMTCACGHKDFRYATAAEILDHKKEILASDDYRPLAREISIRVDSAEICSDCKEQLAFRTKYRPDATIQNLTFSHGLDAFSEAEGDYKKVLKNFEGIVNHPEWEICASAESTRLGDIGIACTGDVTVAAINDLFSYVKNGYRRCNKAYEKDLVYTARDLVPDKEGYGYVEVWIKPQTIKYIWIRQEYSFKEEAAKYFKDLGYEVKIVE